LFSSLFSSSPLFSPLLSYSSLLSASLHFSPAPSSIFSKSLRYSYSQFSKASIKRSSIPNSEGRKKEEGRRNKEEGRKKKKEEGQRREKGEERMG
jgi:hypothetical protein